MGPLPRSRSAVAPSEGLSRHALGAILLPSVPGIGADVTDRTDGESANAALLDQAVAHAILTERFKNHEVRRIVRVLDREVLPDLAARLAGRLENIATRGFDTGPTTTARLKFLYQDLRAFFADLTKRLRVETEGHLVSYAESQARRLARDMTREL